MGIPRLKSYMNRHSKDFLKDHKLHGCPLVIDGNNILYQLYEDSGCDYFYGGDYHNFALYVSRFFTKLLQCKVIPIVIFDGGWEDKKMCTRYNKIIGRLQKASSMQPSEKNLFLPILAKHVFKCVAKQKGVHLIQTEYEADNHIAAVAKGLGCPVLSHDSDFYIYDVDFIPFESLSSLIYYTQEMKNNYIRCKLFKTEHWLSRFPRIEKKALPLVAVLLGNDYIDPLIFKKFFLSLRVPTELVNEYSKHKSHLLVEATLCWLQNRTVDSAVIGIMEKIEKEKHNSVKQTIETHMNGYILPPPKINDTFSQLPQEIAPKVSLVVVQPYRFGDLECEENFELELINENETYLECHPEPKSTFLSDECTRISAPITECNTIPMWFRMKYGRADIPPDFYDIILRKTAILIGDCIEDFSLPASIKICFKIISVIHKLLSKGTNDSDDLKYICRGDGTQCFEILTEKVPSQALSFPFEIPTVQKLPEIDLSMKKQILLIPSGIHDDDLKQFPPDWRIYIVSIKYWIYESQQIVSVTPCHLYALVMSLVLHTVRTVNFYGHYRMQTEETLDPHDHLQHLGQASISDLLRNLKLQECLGIERKLTTKTAMLDRDEPDRRVIHVFNAFQNCLRSIIELNALLDFPYSMNINQAEFFNGILVCKCSREFEAPSVESYLKNFFSNSPSVLQLFKSVVTKILDL